MLNTSPCRWRRDHEFGRDDLCDLCFAPKHLPDPAPECVKISPDVSTDDGDQTLARGTYHTQGSKVVWYVDQNGIYHAHGMGALCNDQCMAVGQVTLNPDP